MKYENMFYLLCDFGMLIWDWSEFKVKQFVEGIIDQVKGIVFLISLGDVVGWDFFFFRQSSMGSQKDRFI